MKVKCFVTKEIEVEIDDKFRKLALPISDLHYGENVTQEDYDACIEAVEKVTGLPFGDNREKHPDKPYIWAVNSMENQEAMLEY